MSFKESTLDADAETHVVQINAGAEALVVIAITGTITITVTGVVNGGDESFQVLKSDGSTDAIYTTGTEALYLVAPGTYSFTASSTSGGSAVIQSSVGRKQ